MIGFPSTTEFNKKIPKQRFYENLSITPALKRVFVEQIQSIVWANKIAPATISVEAGEKVSEIEVFRITLSSDSIDETALRQMDKQIPYHILFVLEFGGKFRLCIGHKETSTGENAFKVNNYYYSPWRDEQEISIAVEGLNMDAVYESLVRQIGGITVEDGNTLDEQIAVNEQREKLMNEIEKLEKKARAEKQPRKKFELVQKINEMKKELK